MKNAIVTGAGGFLTQWLIRELRQHGMTVYAVKRTGSLIENWMRQDENIVLIDCDMKDYSTLPEKIGNRNIDYVFHLAWQGNSSMGVSTVYDIQLQNVLYSLHLIEAASKMHAKRFISAGSIHEAELIMELLEGKPVQNENNYYKSGKLTFHAMGKTLAAKYNIDYFNPIVFNIYGEGDHSNRLVNYVISSMLKGETPKVSSGTQQYDLLHVSDVAHAFYLIALSGHNGSEYTICSGTTRPLKEYLLTIQSIVNNYSNIHIHLDFGGHTVSQTRSVPPLIAENPLLKQHTGFSPAVSFEEGIKRTLEWIVNQNQQ